MIAWILLATPLALFAIGLTAFFNFAPQVGGNPKGKRLKRIQAAPNNRDGKFFNTEETKMSMPAGTILKLLRESMKKDAKRAPQIAIPTLAFDCEKWNSISKNETAFCWFGHSSFMLKIEGRTLLFDPVFGPRASMFSFMGPKHFEYTNHPQVSDLPAVDILILTHDHYDHLDYPTILQLKGNVKQVYASLGVGAHLEKWGFASEQIQELNWWDEVDIDDNLKLACTPSRHFAGRGLTNRFSTLWSSWVIAGSQQKIFFGSDSGYHPDFKRIGEKHGPFDLTLLECGAYSPYWPEIHNTPEEAIQAHLDLGGKILLPIHWAKFDLAQHPWTEPVERLRKQAQTENVSITTPQIGAIVTLDDDLPRKAWWKS